MLDPSRLQMAFTARIFNQFLFWKRYIRPYRSTLFSRLIAYLGIVWYLIGVVVLGGLAAARGRTLQPIRGMIRGLYLIGTYVAKGKHS